MEAKKSLAQRIVARFHSREEAIGALEEFEKRFSKKDLEHSNLPVFSPSGEARDFVSLVVEAYARCFSIAKSRSDARRLIEGGSIQWAGQKVADPKIVLPSGSGGILKLDKTRAVRLVEQSAVS
jgi:tyrosyl-tRNA synthetase